MTPHVVLRLDGRCDETTAGTTEDSVENEMRLRIQREVTRYKMEAG